ncbi:nucleotide sugar dehydrogenase [Streptomyces indicus]|uniref:UDP-N-acetyl-D-mannosaminuronic acid dehydrogenase/UDP-N-acetyl-D-glucosamine dehydrogenase n=1 Tax=Streptomyces indicus TaxID=417292 RepID=A0A1G9CIC7_9ACTN|nr:nucleotide sugar dehydrogenase [Streptomyces indicus]SDK51398.1 UDP-N-acetyl-D-mannosaminuronic acid dehydrogenase/UDP-N-acetyl-D-glucosamine dehydrogenase [Streptomyces indicus]
MAVPETPQPERVAVIGLGYVGLPLAVRAAEAGFDVVGLDVDELRVKRLAAGDSPVEDITGERLLAALDGGRLRVTCDAADLDGFDICVISVPTPLREGAPDLSYVESAGRAVAPHLRPGATVVLESTSYPGTTEDLLRPLLEAGSALTAGRDFHLGYSPERIDPGNARWRLENTPKVVSGVDPASLEAVEAFYDRIVQRTVPVSSTRTAELTKLLENTFRQVNIALVNELALCAGPLGVDIWEAVDAAATKPFGFMPFYPGPGVGGHCLPVDPSYLSWQVRRRLQHDVRFVSLAQEINDGMPEQVVRRVEQALGRPAAGARILLLGLAYKKNTGDVRESPAVTIAERLLSRGARVRAVEPYADPLRLPSEVLCVELTAPELREADAVIVATDHDCIDYELVVREAAYVFDARNRCARARNVERL